VTGEEPVFRYGAVFFCDGRSLIFVTWEEPVL